MEDAQIIELFFARSEDAISELDKKYGKFCHKLADNILASAQDAEECVNDAYLAVWNAIPRAQPQNLLAYLAKTTRNIALRRLEHDQAQKRDSRLHLLLDELAECVAGSESPETELLRKELTASLNRFLRKLPEKDRTVFLLRYYYAGTKEDIARKTGLSSNQVKYILQKVRKQLADTLKKEGLQ